MLNITPKDRMLLSHFCSKNPFFKFEFVTFKTLTDREFYIREFAGAEEIFVRHEYDGAETYLYIFEDSVPHCPFTEKDYREYCKKNNVVISSDDFIKEKKGGMQHE